ncbi:chemotaxis protein CheA [Anaerolinea thermophila]|uniref:Chemotaxis protein CheA n=1 Tax=Anaerolinea thermophila (strain DSM 14523 / JCM 11388 / NBRC 100420 / UNI-1) TaxID=926569 RepID=E8N2Y8_ANATU|nr:chemotaxis protein CheA [Anaerolinea thermophila]BAJ65138.1 putative chemotaxis protein CheA [Anaerolinea thermophila UNI-1]
MISPDTPFSDLEGFFEEADEHLQGITRLLLEFEQRYSGAEKDRPLSALEKAQQVEKINALFRSFHTLKGLCGMVGLSAGAELSHAMESILREIREGHLPFSAELIGALIEGVKRLTVVIAALRESPAGSPAIEDILQRLQAYHPAKAPAKKPATPAEEPAPAAEPQGSASEKLLASLNALEKALLEEMKQAGLSIGVVVYDPTRQPSAGSRVNQVRAFLDEHGKIIKAQPVIENQVVRFAFLWAGKTPPQTPDLPPLDWTPLWEPEATASVRSAPAEPAPPAHEVPAAPAAPPAVISTVSIRVELARMDALMQTVGDLLITRSRLQEILPDLQGAPPAALDRLEQMIHRMGRQVRALRQTVVRMRLVPLAEVFSRMPLAVRDIALQSGKEVQMVLEGAETEIDKSLVERLLDPLLHLVRNAITHGIETPQERLQAGKPAQGTIWVRGRPEGDRVVIEVSDDGRGVDVQKVTEKARALGWLSEDRALNMNEVLEILCRPGFSTREDADMGAGRGVGMNVVLETIRHLGGQMSLTSEPGKGTTFALRLPLTLTILDALIVESGGERYAIPRALVREVIEITPDEVTRFMNSTLITLRGKAVPLFALHRFFQTSPVKRNIIPGIVLGDEESPVCFMVDRVLGIREAVMHPLADPLVRTAGIKGATEMGDGSVVLIVDPEELIYHAHPLYTPQEE